MGRPCLSNIASNRSSLQSHSRISYQIYIKGRYTYNTRNGYKMCRVQTKGNITTTEI